MSGSLHFTRTYKRYVLQTHRRKEPSRADFDQASKRYSGVHKFPVSQNSMTIYNNCSVDLITLGIGDDIILHGDPVGDQSNFSWEGVQFKQ